MPLLLLFLVPILIVSPTLGIAASFDCDSVVSKLELLVCGDSALSDLDSQLAAKYKERRALLSKHGASSLDTSQRNWLSFLSQVLNGTLQRKESGQSVEAQRLEREYRRRIEQLSDVGVRFGPFIFNRIDTFWAEPDDDERDEITGDWPSISTKHVAYPQIDNTNEPFAQKWNRNEILKISEERYCDGAGDNDEVKQVSYANEKMISIVRNTSFYCHHTAHGYGQVYIENLILHPKIRHLDGNELFDMTPEWESQFLAIFWEALGKQGWAPPASDNGSIRRQVSGILSDPSRWRMTAQGIMVEFSPYEAGCYACSPLPVTASWNSLRPMLKKNSPLP